MSKFLNDLSKFLDTQPFDIIHAAEIYDGGEPEVLHRIPGNRCQDVYSSAKAFTMTAIGILVGRGMMSVHDKVTDILSDEIAPYRDEIDPRWFDVDVECAIKYRSGLPGGFLDIDCLDANEWGEDHLRYMFTYPLAYDPGTEDRYNDGTYYMLSRIAGKVSGMEADAFLWKELLYPMGYAEAAFAKCPMGHFIGGSGLYIPCYDYAKFGELYRTGGVWKGRRILTEEWVKTVLEKEYVFDWDDRHVLYFKGGMNGQKVIIYPDRKRVLAVQSFGGNTDVIMKFMRDYG